MHGNAPIEVMLHIYFSFEYAKLNHYQINRPHDNTFMFKALETNENILPFAMLNSRSFTGTYEH
jgi:hypothetical protein